MCVPEDVMARIQARAIKELLIDEEAWISAEMQAYEDLFENENAFSNEAIENSAYGAESYQDRLQFLRRHANGEDLARKIRSPAHLKLLLDLEEIIGSHCSNKNVNAWRGIFRYEPTFLTEGGARKLDTNWSKKQLSLNELAAGRYIFGANQLLIFEALIEVIEMLEKSYRLKVTRKGKRCV